ncbi:5582_t:CDS:2, partial [Cetraspora pellucida]
NLIEVKDSDEEKSTTTDISNLISALHECLELLTNALNSSTESQ